MYRIASVATLALVAFAAAGAIAADWGGVVPGESTMDTVKARYGAPTRTQVQKVDNYDSTQWIYDSAQAPVGMFRMTVDFGLAKSSGYRPDVVRSFKLEPHPGIFTRPAVIDGWGRPTSAAPPGQTPAFFYETGLLVYFDKDGWAVQSMVFTPPQPAAESAGTKR